MGDVISGIGISIGIAAADSIGYWAPAWYRSNPSCKFRTAGSVLTLNGVRDVRYIPQNLAVQELFAGDDEQVAVACQVSSSVPRRIVSYSVSDFESLYVSCPLYSTAYYLYSVFCSLNIQKSSTLHRK